MERKKGREGDKHTHIQRERLIEGKVSVDKERGKEREKGI